MFHKYKVHQTSSILLASQVPFPCSNALAVCMWTAGWRRGWVGRERHSSFSSSSRHLSSSSYSGKRCKKGQKRHNSFVARNFCHDCFVSRRASSFHQMNSTCGQQQKRTQTTSSSNGSCMYGRRRI